MAIASDFAWFKFDLEPVGGPDVAVDSAGIFRNITVNNAGTYDADMWLSPSTALGGSGASVTPDLNEQEFLRLDTLAGAMLLHYWIEVPSGEITQDNVFSYGSKNIKTDNWTIGISPVKRAQTLTSNGLVQSKAITTGEHAICHIIDVANETNIVAIDGYPRSNGNGNSLPSTLPTVNKFGFLLNQNNLNGTDEFGENDVGNLRISDLIIIRIETDKSSLFPALIVDKARAGRFMIPESWEGL
jgi:hypothetical protein